MDARQILPVSGDLDQGARKFRGTGDLANGAREFLESCHRDVTSDVTRGCSSRSRNDVSDDVTRGFSSGIGKKIFGNGGTTKQIEDEMAAFDTGEDALKLCNSSTKLTASGSMSNPKQHKS